MSGKELQIHVGDNLDAMGQRVVDAWHRAERGELTEASAERHIGFETFELFARVMTPRRLELLRHVHRHPPRSIRALSIALGRDYRRVHADVAALRRGSRCKQARPFRCALPAPIVQHTGELRNQSRPDRFSPGASVGEGRGQRPG